PVARLVDRFVERLRPERRGIAVVEVVLLEPAQGGNELPALQRDRVVLDRFLAHVRRADRDEVDASDRFATPHIDVVLEILEGQRVHVRARTEDALKHQTFARQLFERPGAHALAALVLGQRIKRGAQRDRLELDASVYSLESLPLNSARSLL